MIGGTHLIIAGKCGPAGYGKLPHERVELGLQPGTGRERRARRGERRGPAGPLGFRHDECPVQCLRGLRDVERVHQERVAAQFGSGPGFREIRVKMSCLNY